MQNLVDRHAGETTYCINRAAKLWIQCHTQFGGEQVTVVLICIVVEDGFGLCDRQPRVILRRGDQGLELSLCELIGPVLPKAGATDE